MRRHFLLTLLLPVLVFSLLMTSCGRKKETQPPEEETETQEEVQTQEEEQQAQEQTPGEESVSGTEESGSGIPSGEEELVTLVIPADYESIGTQEEADAVCESNGYESAVLLEDGSLSVTMRKSIFDEMMEQFTAAIDQGLKELVGSEMYPRIRSVKHNEDYSVFTVTTDSEEIVPPEEYTAQELIMYGTLYHYYTGNDAEEIRVVFVNTASGQVLEEQSSGGLQ